MDFRLGQMFDAAYRTLHKEFRDSSHKLWPFIDVSAERYQAAHVGRLSLYRDEVVHNESETSEDLEYRREFVVVKALGHRQVLDEQIEIRLLFDQALQLIYLPPPT